MPDDPHRRAVVTLDDGSDVAYRDVRRFGTWLLLEPDEVDAYVDARVGREPLAAAYRAKHLAERLEGRRAPIKAAILDQRTVAGVGNIYADEALWRAQIHPLTPAAALGPDEVKALYTGIREALRAGLRRQGSTLRDYRLPDGGERRRPARVQGLRPGRRAVRPVRHADRQDPRRRPRDVVLPDPAQRYAASSGVEPPVAVEAPELGVAADRAARRSRSAARSSRRSGRSAVARKPGSSSSVDLLVVEPARVEERLRAHAVAAPARRIHSNPGHHDLQRTSADRDSPERASRLAAMASRTYKTEAIVLRSLRFSEADRILHLYTAERGRIGAIAKGVRKTKSRFGARLEPLSHVELMLHEGAGELQTITGVELLRSHHAAREDNYRLNVGLIGAEAMLRLFGEPEANERAFGALARFLDLLDEVAPAETPAGGRPARRSASS